MRSHKPAGGGVQMKPGAMDDGSEKVLIGQSERYDLSTPFGYENGFYLTCSTSRIGKALAQYELYKKILGLPGAIVECGVFKGPSLIRFASYRDLLESSGSRTVIGFDIFGEFPETGNAADRPHRSSFIGEAGSSGIAVAELRKVFRHKSILNYDLVAGNILETVPAYAKDHPEFKIALLHIDTDVYEPAVTALRVLAPLVVAGGLIVFDDYGVFPGETKAVDEYLESHPGRLQKLPLAHIPVFIVKDERR